MNKILVTGGAGYIGSHTCIELILSGYEVVVLDDFSNSSSESIKRVESLLNTKIILYRGDVCDEAILIKIFKEQSIDAVIHFAGLKSVSDSMSNPIEYYNVNVIGTIVLSSVMQKFDCKTLIFSSSATVYGDSKVIPIDEKSSLSPTNPYGRSKLVIENYLKDLSASDNKWRVALLRYFNPVGAHKSGMIGEDSNEPNNLMPYIAQVAIGKREKLFIFGGDYPTKDGTGIRDYIHVMDLANGHIKAMDYLFKNQKFLTLNLGTGKGFSVLDLIHSFEEVSGKTIPFEIIARRVGDVAKCYANPSLAENVIGWKAKYQLARMCKDTWRWQKMNPNGFN
jgi:UDP-glucose 4-epimerase